MYGMQSYGLSRDTGMTRQESTQFIERYMARFSGVRAYLDETIRAAVRNGYVESLYRRRRYVPESPHPACAGSRPSGPRSICRCKARRPTS